jgi:hypothetical protein
LAYNTVEIPEHTIETVFVESNNFILILWLICFMQELLSHKSLGARARGESCEFDRRVARRQLCERLDCATVSRGHVTSAFPQVTDPNTVSSH